MHRNAATALDIIGGASPGTPKKPTTRNAKLEWFADVTPPAPSVSVKQDWKGYIGARQKGRTLFSALLFDALTHYGVKTVKQGRGRTPFLLRDKLFLCIEKVHRKDVYDSFAEFIDLFHQKGYINGKPRPHSVADFMNDPQLTPLLERFITFTSTALAATENTFAVDSTGLGTYGKRWVTVRHEKAEHRDYRKIHTLVGVRTGIITAATTTVGTAHDSPQFIPLLDRMKHYFTIAEVTGDAAYTSRHNAQAVMDAGGFPYFKVMKRLTPKTKESLAWRRMLKRHQKSPELYKTHYSLRSNVESVYSSFKRTITNHLESKNAVSQTNEALCIAITHNLKIIAREALQTGLDAQYQK